MIELHDLYPKFFALEADKRERIINAAMREFLHGFNAAKTDNIVREAGISKGLLFHYFGTKENLYDFLIENAIAVVQDEYVDLINTRQPDLLDSVWQMSLLKQDLSRRFPAIFDFLTSTYMDTRHPMNPKQTEHLTRFIQMRNAVLDEILEHCDKSLFREGIDPMKAINIINWTLTGAAEAMAKQAMAADGGLSSAGEAARVDYDGYLEEFKGYLDIFRRCFYR
ncbi:MAG: TetR/AcrR family transcriptional regulator [Defluviitaleaceae bacterium]|nr:TetR/AcrR family transcriptional regulator [Defluviitaleaceae bacterium]